MPLCVTPPPTIQVTALSSRSPERLRVEDGRGRVVIVRDGATFLVFPSPSGERVAARLEDYLAVGAEIRQHMVEAGR